MWQGILAIRDILRNGVLFNIGNGSGVQIWTDPWIAGIPHFQAIARPSLVNSAVYSLVQDLFLPSSLIWNRALIFSLFSPECARCILNIQPSAHSPVDSLYWQPEPVGVFSVKSAYFLDQATRFHHNTLVPSFNWKKLWSSNLQARLKLLLWKMVVGAMMVRGKLFFLADRLPSEFFLCPFCKHEQEIVEHLFIRCPLAQILWLHARWPLNMEPLKYLDIQSWITCLMNASSSLGIHHVSDRDFLIQAAVICGTIWFSRNLLVHQAQHPNPHAMVTDVHRRLQEHLAAWSASEAVIQAKCTPPPPGFFKVNFDAALRGSTAFLGAVCRPPDGSLSFAWTESFLASNSLMAEFRAAFLACHLASHFGLDQVIFEGNSLTCCRAICELDFLVEGPLMGIIGSIRSLLSEHSGWSFAWAPRKQNQMSHLLAAWASRLFRFGPLKEKDIQCKAFVSKAFLRNDILDLFSQI
ncbi:hypothetical protein CJ030_MR2G025911 [Morella rubra]|uniref:Reverse transcriptase zinc-binding domain-containing protein n=1 Tax=Morella rubra TaxID=262757 RepID=A0A6A1WD26_9ROSI|nr:hypothetical protein CJ030_MR2G025911 [Morella rubra]